jgi:dCTP diphosphatase
MAQTMDDSPTLDDLSAACRLFVEERDWAQFHNPRNLAMALSVEANELLELYLWAKDDGPQPITPERKTKVSGEAADVLLCLLNFCDRAGVDLAKALQDKLVVARKKYPADKVRGKALKYHEYDDWKD